jgi:hypothetical protein
MQHCAQPQNGKIEAVAVVRNQMRPQLIDAFEKSADQLATMFARPFLSCRIKRCCWVRAFEFLVTTKGLMYSEPNQFKASVSKSGSICLSSTKEKKMKVTTALCLVVALGFAPQAFASSSSSSSDGSSSYCPSSDGSSGSSSGSSGYRHPNAGVGNGAEGGATEAKDIDPGRAGEHNQAGKNADKPHSKP